MSEMAVEWNACCGFVFKLNVANACAMLIKLCAAYKILLFFYSSFSFQKRKQMNTSIKRWLLPLL